MVNTWNVVRTSCIGLKHSSYLNPLSLCRALRVCVSKFQTVSNLVPLLGRLLVPRERRSSSWHCVIFPSFPSSLRTTFGTVQDTDTCNDSVMASRITDLHVDATLIGVASARMSTGCAYTCSITQMDEGGLCECLFLNIVIDSVSMHPRLSSFLM